MHHLIVRAICCCTLAVLSANVAVAATDSPVVDHGRINDVFGLWESQLTTLNFDAEPGDAVTVAVPIDGDTFTAEMHPYSVRSAGYQVFHQIAFGELVETEPGIINTLRGGVVELPNAVVAGGWFNGGVVAMIREANGSVHWIEPVSSHITDAPSDLYVVYNETDVMPTGASCAADQTNIQTNIDFDNAGDGEHFSGAAGEATAGGGACGGALCLAELGVDTDVEYFNAWGADTEDRINLVINTVNIQYERDVQITHVISGLIVRTVEPDPYSSACAVDLLLDFLNHWEQNPPGFPYDLAHLFTGKDLDGATIGAARGFAEVCGNLAYCLAQSDFNNKFACATDLTAHELGHLWGAFHCDCPNHTMNAFITCANVFSQESIDSIVKHRDKIDCLDVNQVGIDGAQSILPHGDQAIDLSIDLDDSNGIEPRLGGPAQLAIEMDQEMDGDTVVAENVQIVCAVGPAPNVVATTLEGTSTVVVDIDSMAELDCCNFAFAGMLSTSGTAVGDTYNVRRIDGDVDFSGAVTGGDALLVKPHFGEIVGVDLANPKWDFDQNGGVTGGDFSLIKPKFGDIGADCP